MPGARWLVWDGERLLADGTAGMAELEPERRPLEEATPFDLASLTKPLATAPLLLHHVERGTLELDRPIGDWLALGRWSDRTLRELATHTSGLPAWRPLYRLVEEPGRVLEAIGEQEPAGARGAVNYSDLGYIALGRLIEQVGEASLDRQFAAFSASLLELRCAFARGRAFDDAAAIERSDAFETEMAGSGEPWRGVLEPRGRPRRERRLPRRRRPAMPASSVTLTRCGVGCDISAAQASPGRSGAPTSSASRTGGASDGKAPSAPGRSEACWRLRSSVISASPEALSGSIPIATEGSCC